MKFDHGAVTITGHIQRIDLKHVTDLALERQLSERMDYCGKERSDGRYLEICLEARKHSRPCPFTIGRNADAHNAGVGLEMGIA